MPEFMSIHPFLRVLIPEYIKANKKRRGKMSRREKELIQLIIQCQNYIVNQAIEIAEWTGDKSQIFTISNLVQDKLDEVLSEKSNRD